MLSNIMNNKRRITAALKVETEIIASIIATLNGRTAVLMIMYVETFKADVIAFISVTNVLDNIIFSISQFDNITSVLESVCLY